MSNSKHPNQAWTNTTQYIVSTVLFVLAVAFAYVARNLLAALLIAALISSILMPMVRFLRYRVRLGHRPAAILTYAAFMAFVLAVPALIAPRAIDGVQALAEQITTVVETLDEIEENNLELFGYQIPMISVMDSAELINPTDFVPTDLVGRLSSISSNLVWIVIALVTILYMLLEWENMRDWLFAQAPPFRRNDVRRLYHEIKWVWQAYIRGQFILSLVVGTVTGLATAAIGLQGAWAMGLMAGILDVIPTIGPMIAMGIAAIVGLYTGTSVLPVSNLFFAIIILGVFGTIQSLENLWLRPRILGNSLKIHQGLIFIGVMGAIALSGIFATLIVVPVMGTVGVLGRYTRARMLGISPWPEDENNLESLVDETMVNSHSAESNGTSQSAETTPIEP